MCMGDTHANGGLAAGLGVAIVWKLTGNPLTFPEMLTCGVLAAGAALLPDLDTPSSTVSRSLGSGSQRISDSVRWLSQTAFNASATPIDRRYASPIHRALTHTTIFTIIFMTTITAMAALGWIAVLTIAYVMIGLALRVLIRRLRGVNLVVTTLAISGLVTYLTPSPVALGAAIGAGFYSHILLDGCTTMGVPLFWPLKIRGMRWRRVGTPRFLRFHTNGHVEPWTKRFLGLVSALELIRCLIS